MKIADVKKKNPADLMKLLNELTAEVREFRFEMSGGRTKNVRKARALKRDIARINTVLAEAARK